jgi:mRNA-degrading endonuclease toxin of MazEF toxin-antitoxin module
VVETVDQSYLGRRLGLLTPRDLAAIEASIRTVLGL